jgi:hypothetical protein
MIGEDETGLQKPVKKMVSALRPVPALPKPPQWTALNNS